MRRRRWRAARSSGRAGGRRSARRGYVPRANADWPGWCLLAFVRDAAVRAAFLKYSAGLVRVVARVQVHGDVVGQRAGFVRQAVQGRGEQRGVVSVGAGQDTAQWNAALHRHARAFQALFRGGPGNARHLAASGTWDLVSEAEQQPARRTQADRGATRLAAARQFYAREGHLNAPRKQVEEMAGEGEVGGWLGGGGWTTRRRAGRLPAGRPRGTRCPRHALGGRPTRQAVAR